MSAYRQPSEPQRSTATLVLPRPLAQRALLGACLWFLAFWFLVFPVMWAVEALVRGEGLWRLLVAPPAWLLLVWGIVRLMRFDQVMIGAIGLRRAGFFRDRFVPWKEVRGFEERMKQRARARPVRLYAVQTGGRELLVAPDVVVDPERDLRWCLEQAKAGDLAAIDERVRARGGSYSPWRRRLTHLAIALVLSVGVGAMLWGTEKRRAAERVFDAVAGEPFDRRARALEELYEDSGLDPSLRCRAGRQLMSAMTRQGELEDAAAICAGMDPIGCNEVSYAQVNCPTEPHAILAQTQAALDAGDPERAVGLLGTLQFQAAIRDALEVQALRGSGSPAMARVIAERCVERYGDAEDPVVRAFAERCRAGL